MAENMIVIFFTRGKINQTVGRGAREMKGERKAGGEDGKHLLSNRAGSSSVQRCHKNTEDLRLQISCSDIR